MELLLLNYLADSKALGSNQFVVCFAVLFGCGQLVRDSAKAMWQRRDCWDSFWKTAELPFLKHSPWKVGVGRLVSLLGPGLVSGAFAVSCRECKAITFVQTCQGLLAMQMLEVHKPSGVGSWQFAVSGRQVYWATRTPWMLWMHRTMDHHKNQKAFSFGYFWLVGNRTRMINDNYFSSLLPYTCLLHRLEEDR